MQQAVVGVNPGYFSRVVFSESLAIFLYSLLPEFVRITVQLVIYRRQLLLSHVPEFCAVVGM
jgi:hypothetical protein